MWRSSVVSERSVAPLDLAEVSTWDGEADVVVIGYGVAGASVALSAAAEGADVLVLERTGGWGGAAALSGGFVYLGGGTPLQEECGFDDTAEEMFKFLVAAMGPGADEDKIRLYCDGSVGHYQWLVDNGVEFNPEFYPHQAHEPLNGEGLMYSGGENAWPFNTIARPAPRGHVASKPRSHSSAESDQTERSGGYWLMEPLVRRCTELGLQVEYDVRTDQLIVDPDGRVRGVRGISAGRVVNYRARRGVVMAAGSFMYNEDMMARFAPDMLRRPGAAVESHDGHCIRMAHAMGADLGRMDGCEVWSTAIAPELLHQGIVVNEFGQRFVTEDTYPGRVSQFIRYRADDRAYLVIDDEINESTELGPLSRQFARTTPIAVADTIAEIEREVGLPDGALEATVTLYNRHAENGHDPVFHKNAASVKPLRPPFGVIDLGRRASGFTLGGLRITVDGQVLHVAGHVIPGLFAAGRTASGIPVWGYASGASLGDGSFFGRRAGRCAASG
jgi:3-oxo-5alpha-steroid 4-dehydrogenase